MSVGTLYDIPVSNNGARCRMILYYKEVPVTELAIVSPEAVGGLSSPEYLKLNPHGKMPLLQLASGETFPESDTIARFLCAAFSDRAPQLMPPGALLAARCDRICRHHDLYIAGKCSKIRPPAFRPGIGQSRRPTPPQTVAAARLEPPAFRLHARRVSAPIWCQKAGRSNPSGDSDPVGNVQGRRLAR